MHATNTLPQIRYCSIQSCINFKGTTSDKFHFFKPSMEKHILEKWKEAISQHQNVKNITFVCNLHFEPESLIQMDDQLFLKHGSIPSIFGRIHAPEPEIQNEEVAVKMESMSVESPNTIQLVSINQILQNETTFSDAPTEKLQNNRIFEVDTETCTGCHKRDAKIKTLLVNLDKFKKAYEQKIKLIRYWRSLAVYYKRGNIKPVMVRMNKPKRQVQKVPTTWIKSPIIPTELIKVEGKPHEDMDIDEASTVTEAETSRVEATKIERTTVEPTTIDAAKIETATLEVSTIEITDDEEIDVRVNNKPSVEVLTPLLKPYKCGKCNETFEKSKELTLHITTMHKKPRPVKTQSNTLKNLLKCHICKKQFKLLIYLEKHIKSHTTMRCVVCRVSFEVGQMDQHLCIQEEFISCEHCPEKYSSTEELLDHLESTHNEVKVHKCSTCKQSFRMMFLKIFHERCHGTNKPFKCSMCTKSYTIQNWLIRHQKKDHIDKRDEPESNPRFLCDQCGKEFPSQTKLSQHLVSHRERKYKCPHCPYVSRYSDGLNRHSYIHRNDKFVCTVCGAEKSSPINLRNHMVSQHGSTTRSFECAICTKAFKSKSYLRNHMRVHVTTKGFQCKFCNNSYKYAGELNNHIKTHLGDKIYECSECSERFRLHLELQKHSFTHYKEQQMTAEA